MAMITGTNGNDSLTGTNAADIINGLRGNDIIKALNGNDSLIGDAGGDTLDGGSGIDTAGYSTATLGVKVNLLTNTASGGAGPDKFISIENVSGSSHNDTITGNAVNNVIQGLNGNDLIDGNSGNDTLDGGSGIDTVSYLSIGGTIGVIVRLDLGKASNTMAGGMAGNDKLIGFENATGTLRDDKLWGNDSANNLQGSMGNDLLFGLKGNDTLDGGSGMDTVTFQISSMGVKVNLTQGTATGEGNDKLISIENVIGSSFNDVIRATVGNNSINTGMGTDTIYGGAGKDTLVGGGDTDIVTYFEHTTAVNVNLHTGVTNVSGMIGSIMSVENAMGSAFNDTIIGNSANNNLSGGLGNDMLASGVGVLGANNTLNGGGGIDTVDYSSVPVGSLGGGGVSVDLQAGTADLSAVGVSDTLMSIENAIGTDSFDTFRGTMGNNVFDGRGDFDFIDFSNATAGVTVDLTAGTATGFGNDTLLNIEAVLGSPNNDSIAGTSGFNQLIGLPGADTLSGGVGDDILEGGPGTDSVSGGNENDFILAAGDGDTISGDAGVDTVSYSGYVDPDPFASVFINLQAGTGPGNDDLLLLENVIGSAQRDNITGNNADNFLRGGDGDDVLDGGLQGNDTLDGEAGFNYASYFSVDSGGVVVDLGAGSATEFGDVYHDTLINIEYVQGTADFGDTLTGSNAANGILGLGGNDSLSGLGAEDFIQGDLGNDTIDGGTQNDSLSGLAGNDSILGGAGNDDLIGGVDDDTLVGGAGSDTMDGYLGNDLLQGEVDGLADHFVFQPGAAVLQENDTVTGFEDGVDKLDVSAFGHTDISQMTLIDNLDGTTTIVLDPSSLIGETVTVDVSPNQLSNSDFIF